MRPKEKITHQIKLTIPAIFFTLAALSFYLGKTPLDVLLLYVVASLLAFILYAIDKSAAINGRWRISENKLHLVSLLGGWPGAMIAQQKLRHKSVKQKFLFVFWVTVIVNSAGFSWIHTVDGARVLYRWLGAFHHFIDPVVQRLVS